MIGHLIAHWLGLDNGSGPVYLAWSGFGSDISELAIIGAVIGGYRKHNCHERRCLRLGHHPVQGTPYVACRKHHPGMADKPRRGEIARAYKQAKEG